MDTDFTGTRVTHLTGERLKPGNPFLSVCIPAHPWFNCFF